MPIYLTLWLVDSHKGAIDATNWASGNVGAALHAADLVTAWRQDTINRVCKANDALRKRKEKE
jgi:hypothetical protein